MTLPMIGHLDPQFLEIMSQEQAMLRRVFRTENRVTLPVSATGSGGMEASLVNVIEPGDEVIVGVAGYFAARMAEIASRCGAVVHRLDKAWGDCFETTEIAEAFHRHPRARILGLVHGETSTGALQPLAEIGALCRAEDRLFLVDAVATLGGVELEVDAWQIDVCYSGSQKCLSAPPGLAPLTLGARAAEKLKARKTKVASWYFDLTGLETYWTEGTRAYHHTAPVSMNYALHEALTLVLEEGIEARWARHLRHSRALVAGLEALGCRLFARAGRRMPVVNTVWVPEGVDEGAVRKRLMADYDIEMAGGLGEVAGKVWRVGLMGESSSRDNVAALLGALETILGRSGAVSAASAAYA
jgi:alanine-glyoxylate transaminase/serine-glyoxylate transaminase/serine-pyruvate transaminase